MPEQGRNISQDFIRHAAVSWEIRITAAPPRCWQELPFLPADSFQRYPRLMHQSQPLQDVAGTFSEPAGVGFSLSDEALV